MERDIELDTTVYKVVMSELGQYSIWPAYKQSAPGWSETGKQGNKTDCLEYIRNAWTDMRPKSGKNPLADKPAA